jgi:hypothetical protein
LAHAAQAASYVALLADAQATGDASLLQDVVDRALAAGADEKSVADAAKKVDALRKAKFAPKADAVTAVRARMETVPAQAAETYLTCADRLSGEVRTRFRTRLLRAALLRDQQHAAAIAAAREMVPPELRGARTDPLDALALAEAIRRTALRIVRLEPGESATTFEELELEKAQKSWRPELYAVRSERMLVVTPEKRLGELAKCVAVGELACRANEEFFKVPAGAHKDREPLVVMLAASRDEYLKKLGGPEFAAGHYDNEKNISYFYMDDGSGGVQTTTDTMAHELTHHWLRARSPDWPFREFDATFAGQKGFWVVEGFASFVEGFSFDFEAGTYTTAQVEPYRFDDLVHAKGIPPWKEFFTLTQVGMHRAPRTVERIPSSLRLGTERYVDSLSLFYAQATATTRYLYEADNGAYRATLMQFLRSYYAGKLHELDICAILKVDPDELGKRIERFARAVLAGK